MWVGDKGGGRYANPVLNANAPVKDAVFYLNFTLVLS